MPPREIAIDVLQKALAAEPRPISQARVMEVARANLTRPLADQFEKWFGPNGARFMENLNGKP